MIAFFPGKFQPPHLGHIISIMKICDQYEKLIVAISNDGPKVLSQIERKKIFDEVFRLIDNVEVITVKAVITEIKDIKILPRFDICLSGNINVINKMKSLGARVKYVHRSRGIGFRSTEIRDLV